MIMKEIYHWKRAVDVTLTTSISAALLGGVQIMRSLKKACDSRHIRSLRHRAK
jgi:hypothetical protein